MSNSKLCAWARILRRPMCQTCGELYGTATITDPAGTRPACTFCAEWVADGSPEDYDDTAYWAALAALPWLLRHRPNVRDLRTACAQVDEARDDATKKTAYHWYCCQFDAAWCPVKAVFEIGEWTKWVWYEMWFHAGNIFDWLRITITRPACARCDAKAITTTQLRAGQRRRTPLCNDCHYAIAEGVEVLLGGAR